MIFPSPINVLCKDLTEESTSTVHRNSLNLNSDLEQCRWFIYSCALNGDTTTTTRRKARKSQPWKWQIIEKERLKNSSSIKNTEKFLVKHCGRRVHILWILYDMKELNMDTGAFLARELFRDVYAALHGIPFLWGNRWMNRKIRYEWAPAYLQYFLRIFFS